MKRIFAVIILTACSVCLLSCHRLTPEEELLLDLQKILKEAYGNDYGQKIIKNAE